MQNPKVIIIGGGPVGLLAAATLAKYKIAVRIFEKEEKRIELSKALAVHAGTLEYLEVTHPQLLAMFLAQGKKLQRMNFGGKYNVNLNLIPSKYNFVLGLEQNETERLLAQYLESLGGQLERGCELINAREENGKVVAILKSSDGNNFEVSGDYLLDCSGAHSIIRKDILRLSFHGEKYLGRLLMADIAVKSELAQDEGYLTRNQTGLAGFLPLNEKPFFRVILIPQIATEIPQEIPLQYFLEMAKKIAPEIELGEENKWLTSFELSRRMVEKLRVGRIFLAGDAAHIHSPVGGQGMNLGMQDALNISLKLKHVLLDDTSPTLLDDYEKQRLPIIKEVLRLTNAAMRSGFEKSFLSRVGLAFLRKIIAPIFFRSKFLQKILVVKLSQIESARKEIKWAQLKSLRKL